ncbi:PTS sugar transporter subunit IIB [Tetragenococcus halophilus]|uniref:PTS system mannose/fructose/N-acetylgalactosamine-transporter subunit IIB n=1 Tax=Tetragenococcus halophilus TaxID=51669 RepID=UPI001F431AFF|nr:PTS sugar transporter subunit IIB [Tetragenococcus halophilus]MCF1684246.1 PTS sugar transporter subunit IIB [Tetragenococcus halophilus]
MSEIVLTRIDDRLIHGQVMTAWVHETKGNEIVIIDDEVAQDDFLKMIIDSSAPKGINVKIFSQVEAVNFFNESENNEKNIIILVKTPQVIEYLISQNVRIDSVNVGGMGARKDRFKLFRNISVNEEEVNSFKNILNENVDVFVQVTPDQKKANIKNYL